MIIELALTGGAAYMGGRLYRQKVSKRKKLIHVLHNDTTLERAEPSISMENVVQEAWQWLKTGETLTQQKKTLANPKLAAAKRYIHKLFLVSTASFILSTIGLFGFPLINLLSLPGLVYIFYPMGKESYKKLKTGTIDVFTLATIVIGGTIITGDFFVGNFTAFMIFLAKKMVMVVQEDVQQDFANVFQQHPDQVWIMVDETEISIPFDKIKIGDTVVVHAGEMIPIDGTVQQGIATVDQHILTGESQPAEKEVGDQVFASTVLISGELFIEVEQAGNNTTVAKIGQILNKTTDFKTGVEMRSDELSNKTVIPTLLLGAATLPFMGPNAALAVLNSHFKARMSVFAPISTLNFFKIASEHGILIKDGRSLDLLCQVDTIVFDKTGTLTQEVPQVGQIHTFYPAYSAQDVLRYAAAAEKKQTHPIAKAIVGTAKQQNIAIPNIDEAEYKVGYGLNVRLEGKQIRVGSLRFMELEGLAVSPEVEQCQATCHLQAYTLIMVACDDQIIGGLELVPSLRPETKAVLQQLRQRKQIKATYIISGDHEIPTRRMAEDLGIDHYFAETLPQDKARLIEALQKEGKRICYIGDGINDSIALKIANVSISLRGASTVAKDTAQIVFMDGSLTHLDYLFDIGKRFHSNINWVFALTVAPMIIGLGGIYFFNIGLLATAVINKFGTIGGIGVAMLPRRQYQNNKNLFIQASKV